MTETKEIEFINIPKGTKYKNLCNKLINKFYRFTYKDDNYCTCINIPKLMGVLIYQLQPKKNSYYARHIKYTQLDIINGIFDVLSNCTYWKRYKGLINGEYLRQKHMEYSKLGVYACMYKIIVNIYFKKRKYLKLKEQSIDSTFIRNLYGKELIQRNPHYNSKNGIKVSTIDDKNGVPTNIAIAKGAKNDAIIGIEQVRNNGFIDYKPKKVKRNNKFRPRILGDSHYYHNEFKQIMKRKGYNIYTDVNIRNTKDKDKLKEIAKDKRDYQKVTSKRGIKETSFSWMHKYPKLDRFVEKTIKSYSGLLLLGYSLIVSNKIARNIN